MDQNYSFITYIGIRLRSTVIIQRALFSVNISIIQRSICGCNLFRVEKTRAVCLLGLTIQTSAERVFGLSLSPSVRLLFTPRLNKWEYSNIYIEVKREVCPTLFMIVRPIIIIRKCAHKTDHPLIRLSLLNRPSSSFFRQTGLLHLSLLPMMLRVDLGFYMRTKPKKKPMSTFENYPEVRRFAKCLILGNGPHQPFDRK